MITQQIKKIEVDYEPSEDRLIVTPHGYKDHAYDLYVYVPTPIDWKPF